MKETRRWCGRRSGGIDLLLIMMKGSESKIRLDLCMGMEGLFKKHEEVDNEDSDEVDWN